MRMSRVLLAGVAVAAAGVTTSAFTASNTFTPGMDNVAGYGELTASGVAVTNIAYNPATDASKLQSVVFTVDTDTTTMAAKMTLTLSGAATATSSASVCSSTPTTITCILTTPVAFQAFNMTGLTVTSS
jgi:hypothetical protein